MSAACQGRAEPEAGTGAPGELTPSFSPPPAGAAGLTAEQAHPAAQTPANGLRDDSICLYICLLSWRHRQQTVPAVRGAQQGGAAAAARSLSSVLNGRRVQDHGQRQRGCCVQVPAGKKGENLSDTTHILSRVSCPLVPAGRVAAQATRSVRRGDSKWDLHRHPGMFEEKGGGARTDTNQHSS